MPETIRDAIRDKLWKLADDMGWSFLADSERSRYYEQWTKDESIGGQLGHFMDPRKVRVYIKDSLIKPYERVRMLENEDEIWRLLSLPQPTETAESFIKPHGRRLEDGKVVCWGKSRDWKLVLMAVFERARTRHGSVPFGAVLVETGQTTEKGRRTMIGDAGTRLGLERIAWID